MAGRLEFKEKLGDILKEAIAQGSSSQKTDFPKNRLILCVIICCLRKYRFMAIRRSRV